MNLRITINKILFQVIYQHSSLDKILSLEIKNFSTQQQAFIKACCYGVLRWYFRLDWLTNQLLITKLRNKDNDLKCLILQGLHELIYMQTPDYAVVTETVNITRLIKKKWAAGLVNKILRKFLLLKSDLLEQANQTLVSHYSHPKWMITYLQQSWPNHWASILAANNYQAPLFLRVNTSLISRDDYLLMLQKNNIEARPLNFTSVGITLKKACAVDLLPGFYDGLCSIQDFSGQLVIPLLDLDDNQFILDACAAPGSKTCHILEVMPNNCQLTILDKSPDRLERVNDNINRLKLTKKEMKIICGDASIPSEWFQGSLFDRILLDAPCSGSGVIRRHPDIKLLRMPSDIDNYSQNQIELLRALWVLLKKGGKLVYSTCSVFIEENEKLVTSFIAERTDCRIIPIHWSIKDFNSNIGLMQQIGYQILPSLDGGDGFYYAVLQKI